MRFSWRSLSRTLLLSLLVSAMLSGCGFRLRGSYTLSGELPSLQLYLQQPGAEAARLLRRALTDAGVALSEVDLDSLDTSMPVLSVGAEVLVVRPITVTPRARAAQYDMRIGLPVTLRNGQTTLLGPEEELTVQQIYYENTDNIVGTLEERATIQAEMRRVLIDQLIRRIETAIANQPRP